MTSKSSKTSPNILFVLLDDLGWGDLSMTTGQFPTPNMDSLMTNALRLDRHYVHLMCSPSRTQFLTGRYAMNLGFGVFLPWDSAEMGGIPVGQPTIADWLRDFGEYTTYGVGKWHLGYANEQLTPMQKGFDHFFGFYQGALDYYGKTYNDIEAGDIGAYDFWNDGQEDYDVIEDTETITMRLYEQKMLKFLDVEANKRRKALASGAQPTPFYMFAALQSMHVPFPDEIPEYEKQCLAMLEGNAGSTEYLTSRKRYCSMILLTDDVVGNVMTALREQGLYEDTLVIFTTDNGGETARGASNYPFRGTKGELWEGNTRVLTALSGGVIEKMGLFGGVRQELFSNLDWTPTLLEFAGYLDCIRPADYTWDGQSQYAMLTGDVSGARDHLVLNIGDSNTDSASILMEHEGALFKYIKSDPDSATDRWIYSGYLADVWSAFDDDLVSLKVVEYDEHRRDLQYSQVFGNGFLFDLSNDPSELYNLLNPASPGYSADVSRELVKKAQVLLDAFMREDALFSNPIDFLHARLPLGDPGLIGDGMWVRPFLDDEAYFSMLDKMFQKEEKQGKHHSEEQLALYYTRWSVPQAMASSQGKGKDSRPSELGVLSSLKIEAGQNNNQILTILIVVGSVCIAVLICMIVVCHCNKERKQRRKWGEYAKYQLLNKEDEAGYRTFPN